MKDARTPHADILLLLAVACGERHTAAEDLYSGEGLDDVHWWVEGRLAVLRHVVSSLHPRPLRAIDVGAGTGQWLAALRTLVPNVCAVEPDRARQRRIRERVAEARLIGGALPGPLPFGSGTFDLVTCLDVLEHIDDDLGATRELARIVHPNGVVLVAVPAHPALWSQTDELWGHRRRYSREALDQLMSGAGLRVDLLTPLNVWLYPLAAAARAMKRSGTQVPMPVVNRALSAIFASERRFVGRWPRFARGLSWLCVARRP